MACYHPIHGFRSKQPNETGKYYFVFPSQKNGDWTRPQTIACNKCSGCKNDRAQMWAVRSACETAMQPTGCFLTLTYAIDPITLEFDHFQKFMKKLRKHFAPIKIKMYHCGEYGPKLSRPHYHALIWGINFENDMRLHQVVRGNNYYISETLSKLWTHGFHTIGELNFKTAGYCARYISKKKTAMEAELTEHYHCPVTGVIKTPEYSTMSQGIGLSWLEKYYKSVLSSGKVILRTDSDKPPREFSVPPRFDKWLEKHHEKEFKSMKYKRKRITFQQNFIDNNSEPRLKSREESHILRINKLKREMEP